MVFVPLIRSCEYLVDSQKCIVTKYRLALYRYCVTVADLHSRQGSMLEEVILAATETRFLACHTRVAFDFLVSMLRCIEKKTATSIPNCLESNAQYQSRPFWWVIFYCNTSCTARNMVVPSRNAWPTSAVPSGWTDFTSVSIQRALKLFMWRGASSATPGLHAGNMKFCIHTQNEGWISTHVIMCTILMCVSPNYTYSR